MDKNNQIDEIAGYSYVKQLFNQMIYTYSNQDIFLNKSITLNKNLLIYGPKGYGKTFMANCLLEELKKLGYKVYEIIPELKDDIDLDHHWKEDSENKVCEEIWDLTSDIDKSEVDEKICIFFDNLDNHFSVDDDSVLNDEIQNYFEYLSKIQRNFKNFLVIGICNKNRISDSWPYFRLFEHRLHIAESTYEDRKNIISNILHKTDYGSINIDDITYMIPKRYSFKRIQTLIKNASIDALCDPNNTNLDKTISTDYIVKAFNFMEYDNDMLEIKDSEENILETAVHEAGHAVVAHILKPGSVTYISSVKEGRKNNFTDGITYMDDEIDHLDNICISLGSLASVELKLHKHALGVYGDIDDASRDAEILVTLLGQSGLSLVAIAENKPSQELLKSQENAIHNLLQEQYIRAKMIVQSNLGLLDFITEELIKKGYVFKSEILKYCNQNEIKTFQHNNLFSSIYNKKQNSQVLG